MHFGASLVPIKVLILSDFMSPIFVIVRIGFERREDMRALTTAENVNSSVVINWAMSLTAAQQASKVVHILILVLFHVFICNVQAYREFLYPEV
jgi:hypothetical protein